MILVTAVVKWRTVCCRSERESLTLSGRSPHYFPSEGETEMQEAPQRDYQSIPDMDQQVATVSGNRFFVILAGKTDGAHGTIIKKLKAIGQKEVFTSEESDYLVVVCPIASRVGTDISEALEDIEGGKPIILAVMHHTFNPDHVIADSRRQVDNRNVVLTVDYLFYEGNLLGCNRNEIASYDIQKAVRGPAPPSDYTNWLNEHRKLVTVIFILILVGLLILILIICST